jgi:hypothetical protein
VTEIEQHRSAFRAVMEAMPDSQHLSHTDERNPDWQRCDIAMPGQVADPGPEAPPSTRRRRHAQTEGMPGL